MGKEDSSSIKHWPEDERPRERLVKYGGEALSEAQLLAILIGSGDRSAKKSAVDICRDLLKSFDNLSNLDRASVHELCQVKGIGLAKAAQIKAALEVGKRMASTRSSNHKKMNTSRALVDYFAPFMNNLRKEVVKIALLDNKLHIINDFVISEGSVDSSIVHPREVMIPAIRESATKIVLLHNHPSGDPTPSRADIEITHRVSKAGNIIGIQLLDHIIIGGTEYYSFADEGMI
ncbi:MAG: DNA repair protein RadC [Nitrospinota bacterium]|nr:DNA repair protein RadC [Nitrospinota bacterium]